MNIGIANISAAVVISGIAMTSCSHVAADKPVSFADFAGTAVMCLDTDTASAVIMAEETVVGHQAEFDAMAAVMGLGSGNDAVRDWIDSPAVRFFGHEVDSVFKDSRTVEKQLTHIVSVMEREGLSVPAKSYASVIWGRPQSIVFADSVMLIALNHYLGGEHPAYSSLPAYRRRAKDTRTLPYDMAEALVATACPPERNDSTLVINRLIYEGALAYARMILVEGGNMADALGYSSDELRWLEDNERELWRKMLTSRMVFDKSEATVERLLYPAPFTNVLSGETPGRAGRYIGYKIVRSYVDGHRDTKLSDLLSPAFYGKANPLTYIHYNP